MQLHIVLAEPEIPQNTGNVARTCAAIGANLHVIHPLGFEISEKRVRRAGLDYWHLVSVREWPSMDAFFEEVPGESCCFFSTKGAHNYSDASFPEECYFLYGPETRGLPEDLLREYGARAYRIPMRREARSLNLSNAVAITAYEWCRQRGFPGLLRHGTLTNL